ncbi:uncharacterized protein DUF262 [Bisgaardia hudsonensis]|uniref:Uncharacterized protein DUF262 n=1 Tax=Bisgaardia hudsonensis TaxID=109472 RepID=A0A4R2N0S8_9PAST|nr:DUF262 domain-containing protein [Bisgaardia hudsonensis]QLB13266.1 hypothetical protein A6A11_06380 [Bisgaardia hudsonensis]TCP13152.1 uncharacterized protein DUF262 [Bisgaardia hudsonensis]
MALLEKELEIINLEQLFGLTLSIPDYQRPYRWTTKSTNILFSDTYEAFKNNLEEYRLGSVILHLDKNEYNIVDGQQRLTTLAILLYCLDEKANDLLQEKYNELSVEAVKNNNQLLSKLVGKLEEQERQSYKEYILKNCKIVKIVTDNVQEAFQFFDSQNSRGKELEPHDLLKSYHLREMNNESNALKLEIIEKWENVNSSELSSLFKDYLYPIKQWYKGKNGLGYNEKKIHHFKGIKMSYEYNYVHYHKASAIYIENFNGFYHLDSLSQFQLTQPIISGKRFFYYVYHYYDLLNAINEKIEDFYKSEQINLDNLSRGAGNIYILRLYKCALLFFVDRFGLDFLDVNVMRQLFYWSYSLRLVMNSVYLESINKYARGRHERINSGLNIFNEISEMKEPKDILLLDFENILSKDNLDSNGNYEDIIKKIKLWNGVKSNV